MPEAQYLGAQDQGTTSTRFMVFDRAGRALGVAYAAGFSCGFYKGTDELAASGAVDRTWTPAINEARRARLVRQWGKAVGRSFAWAEE